VPPDAWTTVGRPAGVIQSPSIDLDAAAAAHINAAVCRRSIGKRLSQRLIEKLRRAAGAVCSARNSTQDRLSE